MTSQPRPGPSYTPDKRLGSGQDLGSGSDPAEPRGGRPYNMKARKLREGELQAGEDTLSHQSIPGESYLGDGDLKLEESSREKSTIEKETQKSLTRREGKAAYGKKGYKWRKQQLKLQQQQKTPLDLLPVRVRNTMWSVTDEPNARVDDRTQTKILQARNRVKADVQFAIQKQFGTQYTVEYFGSTRYGVSHSHSDLDMVIIDPGHPQGFVQKDHTEPIYKARTVASAMKRAGFIDVEFRARSAVPIVRFKDMYTGLECDLCLNERLGIVNSDMIKEYCNNSNVLRSLLFRIKEWAKPLRLNSPSTDGKPPSFSSYAFAMMTITFLQSEGLLPNLQADLPALSREERPGMLIWSQRPHYGWDTRFRKLESYTPPIEPDVDVLLLKWYQFWAAYPYDIQCASIRHGAFLPRDSPLIAEFGDTKKPAPICVLDPFIRTKNVTVGITKKVLHKFRKECESAASRMQEPEETSSDPVGPAESL
ncbi:Nucleotidyltransferase [Pholiota conissans]|uniref:Nucleotidyltransferase n=1 Tax=Pholiota conissans TaxID=109636 RepID=A0A9P5YQW7_9AGAR|nr:Nucleotidyltransferase [Pholiota conissans]